MNNCEEKEKEQLDMNLDFISMYLDDCIVSHEPEPEVLSNYCNYEIPEYHYGERELTPDYLE